MSKKLISWLKKYEIKIALICSAFVSVCVAFVMLFIYEPNQNALGALGTVCMDIVSMLILLILIISFSIEKKVKEFSRTTRLFIGLMTGTMVALFFDFLTWASDGSLAYGHLNYLFILSSLCMGAILALIFEFYLSSYLDDIYNIKDAHSHAKACASCNLIAFLVTVVLALTKTAFVIVDGHYEVGALYDIVTVIPLLTLLYMTVIVASKIKIIGIRDAFVVAVYIFTMIAGVLIEAMYRVGTTYVSLAIADVFIFVMLQNKAIEKEKKNVQKWILKSNTDELTNFYNRHAYEDEIIALEEGKINENLVYVSVDVNGLKLTNDSLGHEAGDELLSGACECMKRCFGAYGKLFRTGGDEFVALIYADEDQLIKIKKDIDEVTEEWEGKLVDQLAISCGYVTRREAEGMTLHEMAVLADKRMYANKAEYYRKKGIDRRGQRDAHVALCALYSKIIKINVTDDTYQIVNVNEDDKTYEKGFSDKLSVWMSDFAMKGQVHPEDLKEYLEKTKLEYISNYFKSHSTSLCIIYRRKYHDEYKKTMMEIIPANEYTDDSQILFLYVKNIE